MLENNERGQTQYTHLKSSTAKVVERRIRRSSVPALGNSLKTKGLLVSLFIAKDIHTFQIHTHISSISGS